MTGRIKALKLGGVSAFAIVAMGALSSTDAQACTATATQANPAAIVSCAPGTPVGTFATSYDVDSLGFSYDGSGNDQITVGTGAIITATGTATPVVTFTAAGPTIFVTDLNDSAGTISLLAGNDVFSMNGGTIGAPGAEVDVDLGNGNNSFSMLGGVIFGDVIGLGGNDTFTAGTATINGAIYGNGGDDAVTINAGAAINGVTGDPTLTDAVGLGTGNDTFIMNGGTLGSAGAPGIDVSGNEGDDRIELNAGAVLGDLLGNEGNDTIIVRGGSVGEEVRGNEDNDTITISGGAISQNIAGDDGNDTIGISGGTIGGSVLGGAGIDGVTMSGGTVNGNIDAEEVTLNGGTLLGNVTGITGNTLTVQDNGSLNLQDGVTFTGTGAANGTVRDTNLAQDGAESQIFTGFANLSAFGSQLSFAGSNIGIAQLNLSDGSTLFVNGNVNLTGILTLTGSTVDMLDGVADDVFTLGGLVLNGSNLLIDFDQQTLQADRLNAGTFAANGVNTIVVNLLGTPQFSAPTDIVIINSGGAPIAGTFNIATIPGTTGSLFVYQVLAGPGGGLILRATPADFGVVGNTQSAVDNSTVDNAVEALYGIVDDAIVADLALGNGSKSVPIGDSFGIFASGAFSQTNHDGYTVTNGPLVNDGAGFRANDFSAAISLDFNAAKHFGFDDKYGLNIGVFGGYASTDVTLGNYLGFTDVGEGLNKSGMFGAYTLFRQGTNYGLLAVSGFLGGTDITNGVLNTTASYDTEGYAVNGSVGKIFALSDRVRFDLRGGVMGVTFSGDGYTDSGGNVFGKSRVKFGAVKFEPGIYADYQLENGMVISPYARGELQQRFGYENTASVDGQELQFDDADFSAAVSTGFNLRMSEKATLSSEIRGKLSEDSSTIGAKLGIKVGF